MAQLFEPPRYIAVEGPIRAGKSTLARLIAERLRARLIEEPEGSPFLKRFYAGDPHAAFPAQMDFLVQRFERLHAIDRESRAPVVADYIFEKDKLFACINLSDQELRVYDAYYDMFRKQLATPDLVIYLQATPEALSKRVRRKNAPEEQEIAASYIEEVVRAYEHFFFHYTASDLLVVNINDLDFVDSDHDLAELLRRLEEPIRGPQYFLPLSATEEAKAEKARA